LSLNTAHDTTLKSVENLWKFLKNKCAKSNSARCWEWSGCGNLNP